MISKRQFSWKSSFVALILTAAPTVAVSAGIEANSLEVHVLDRQSGAAIAEAAVCLGTAAKPDQFGALSTGADGIARFEDLPPNSLLVTVSKRGLQGIQQRLEPVSQKRVIVLKPASGGGGPYCDAPAAAAVAAGGSGLTIERVSVSENPGKVGADEVLVSVKVSGTANQLRVSENADFASASWQAFRSPFAFKPSPGKGSKQVFVQVRHHMQTEGASIEVVSPVERVTYRR
jgi:hypothetical protein